ncbi:benzoylformate decarboxylase [Novosphingobium sp. FKTRR1]|uniref:benzoylformate decarboxylase n=1 Tax=Novosphingobium sp. FKTRR1 TaxID=2879118 RepID=UPI001CF07388
MQTVRDVTIALLRDLNMTRIFGNPGSTELPLFRDFPDDFSYVLGLQESVVLGMADGYAQASGTAALVNLHSSAGTGHALGNLFTAFKNQTPLVVTAGQQARAILPYDPFLYAERATEFPQPFVKWAIEPARAEDVPAAIARAWHIAMQAPQGPTFVSIPIDDWDKPCPPFRPHRMASANPGDPAALTEAAQWLAQAERPAFVVGAGAARDGAWDALIALAERHRAAVWVAPMAARNAFPEDHPLFAGFLTAMRERIVADLAGHDLIVAFGGPVSLYHVEGAGPHLPETARAVFIADNPSQAAWAPCDLAIVADTRLAAQTLLDGPAPAERAAPPPRTPAPALTGAPFSDAYLLQQIARLRPHGSVIVEEAPSSRGPMHDYLPITARDTFYTCASGGLGHGLPAAIGVALARPDDKIIAVLGDGSSMYAIQGLWTAARLGLSITFIIINNGRYEALHHFGRQFGMQRLEGTDLSGIDFADIARAQGLAATTVSEVGELDAALAGAFVAEGPTLIDVRVE